MPTAGGRLPKEELTGQMLKPVHMCLTCATEVYSGQSNLSSQRQIGDPVQVARFGRRVQTKAMELGLVVMGMSRGVDGSRGDHIILSPAYTISEEEVEKIVRRTVGSSKRFFRKPDIKNGN